jgi:hypothetical protein
MNFTVIQVTLSLRFGNSDQVSTDNLGRLTYQNALGTTNLGGPFLSTGTSDSQWRHGIEILGTVYPSDLDEFITIKREIVEFRQFNNQTLERYLLQCPDTSPIPLRDDDPQSNNSQGKIYDLDAPGTYLGTAFSVGRIVRLRTNFRQRAVILQPLGSDAVETVVSDDINWFQRLSIIRTSNGSTPIDDVHNDNIIRSGSTNLTWNLTSSTGTLPLPGPCPQN